MNFFKVEKNLAILLLIGALAGVSLANFGGASILDSIESFSLGAGDFSMTLEGWIHNFGIPAFFALVGLELRREFNNGLFVVRKAIAVPALAAVFGVIFPAFSYLAVVGLDSSAAAGWPIPTATDVTFALAVFLIFGKGLPPAARIFLLAFAIIDDVIGILVITFMYAGSPQPIPAILAALALALFYFFGRALTRTSQPLLRVLVGSTMWAVAFLATYLTMASGLQPTITGVLLGLLVPIAVNPKLEDQLHPWIAGLVLPIFALMTTGIYIELANVWSEPVFWAVLSRPIAKIIGITFGAYLGYKITGPIPNLPLRLILRVSVLGGIGFTVSLLICQITFALEPAIQSAAIAATLMASVISGIAGAVALLTAHGAKTRNSS